MLKTKTKRARDDGVDVFVMRKIMHANSQISMFIIDQSGLDISLLFLRGMAAQRS
jgi:hypothetical protein